MQSVDSACEEGERAYKKAKLCRSSSNTTRTIEVEQTEIHTAKPVFCIHTKLRELFEQERLNSCSSNNSEGLRSTSHLLEKLVAQYKLNSVILNLYPGNKGYSLAFEGHSTEMAPSCSSTVFGNNSKVIESRHWPYEEEELLRCIDREELPSFFSDIFENHFSYVFYSGCVIVQVRDYRQSYPHSKCDIHHVLLKPSIQSIVNDLNTLSEDKDWGVEEKQILESQILAANHPTLCLDPKASICETQAKLNHTSQLLNTQRLRRTARKFSQVSVNRKRKHDQFSHRPGLELFNYLTKTRNKSKTATTGSSLGSNRINNKKVYNEIRSIPAPTLDIPITNLPTKPIVINEFKQVEYPLKMNDCLPRLLEEYVLETEMPSKVKGVSRTYHIKLSIKQRPSNFEYLGELYLDRDYKEGEKNGVACQFSLGCRADAARYVQQFAEIFTEGGRKPVNVQFRKNPIFADKMPDFEAQQTPLTNFSKQTSTKPIQLSAVNGVIVSGASSLPQEHSSVTNASTTVATQVKTQRQKLTTSEMEINALATKLMNSVQQFQAAENAKQQQKLAAVGSNIAIRNLLNSSPANNLNSDTSAAVIHAINHTSLPQQIQTINNKLIGRKITFPNIANARVLNNNLITVNNNTRISLTDTKGQTIAIKATNSNFAQSAFSNLPIKHLVNQRVNENTSALSALLVGTPAADRPDIGGTNNNPLLLEKLGGVSVSPSSIQSTTNFLQNSKTHYAVQSPKSVSSPLSSPPQGVPTLQNVQVQLPGFSQPISLSLNVSSGATLQGPHGSIIVSMPSTATATTISQQSATSLVTPVTNSTIVLTNAGRAQLVTSGIKALTQKNLMAAASSAGITLSQASPQFQLVTPVQRPRIQQNSLPQNLAARGMQRTPIVIKTATPNTTTSQVMLPLNSSLNSVSQQQQLQIQQLQIALQKQVSVQPYQQICANQQNIARRVLRRSNTSDTQQ